jgi:hypothetical protein
MSSYCKGDGTCIAMRVFSEPTTRPGSGIGALVYYTAHYFVLHYSDVCLFLIACPLPFLDLFAYMVQQDWTAQTFGTMGQSLWHSMPPPDFCWTSPHFRFNLFLHFQPLCIARYTLSFDYWAPRLDFYFLLFILLVSGTSMPIEAYVPFQQHGKFVFFCSNASVNFMLASKIPIWHPLSCHEHVILLFSAFHWFRSRLGLAFFFFLLSSTAVDLTYSFCFCYFYFLCVLLVYSDVTSWHVLFLLHEHLTGRESYRIESDR